MSSHSHGDGGTLEEGKEADPGVVVVVRVPHGYTAGTIFPHRTRTRVHRDPWRVVPLPNRNSRGVKRVPAVFVLLIINIYTNI